MLGHLHRLSLDVFDRRRLGDLISRITSDVQPIETLVLSGVADGLSAVLRILFFGTALFILDWQLALVALDRRARPSGSVAKQLLAADQARLAREAPPGRLAELARRGDASRTRRWSRRPTRRHAVVERFRRQNEGVVEAELAAVRIHGLFTPLVDLIELAGVLVRARARHRSPSPTGSLSIGGMLVFVAYLTQLYSPIRSSARSRTRSSRPSPAPSG